MTMELEDELRVLIIKVLNLEDVSPEDIDRDAPLFGEGLGLDSIDALELGLALKREYQIILDKETKEIREHFSTLASLAKFVSSNSRSSKGGL